VVDPLALGPMMAPSPPERFAGPPSAPLPSPAMLSFFNRRPGLCSALIVTLAGSALLWFVTDMQAQDRALLKACQAGPDPAACMVRLYGR
jgi:hypothetical protein